MRSTLPKVLPTAPPASARPPRLRLANRAYQALADPARSALLASTAFDSVSPRPPPLATWALSGAAAACGKGPVPPSSPSALAVLLGIRPRPAAAAAAGAPASVCRRALRALSPRARPLSPWSRGGSPSRAGRLVSFVGLPRLVSARGVLSRRGFVGSLRAPSGTAVPEGGKPATAGGGKFSAMWKQYGLVSVAVYAAISAVDLVLFFWAISIGGPGVLKPIEELAKKYLPDMSRVFGKAGAVPDLAKEVEARKGEAAAPGADGGTGNGEENREYRILSHSLWTSFALAYGFHKLFLPVRVPIAAMITPPVARMVRRWGWEVSGAKIRRLPPSARK